MAEGRIEKELATVFGRETGMASPLPSECGGPAPLPEPNAAATLEGKMGLHPWLGGAQAWSDAEVPGVLSGANRWPSRKRHDAPAIDEVDPVTLRG